MLDEPLVLSVRTARASIKIGSNRPGHGGPQREKSCSVEALLSFKKKIPLQVQVSTAAAVRLVGRGPRSSIRAGSVLTLPSHPATASGTLFVRVLPVLGGAVSKVRFDNAVD